MSELAESGQEVTLTYLISAMHRFVQMKGWYGENSSRPQTPRNLATSVAVEAAELLECFQWGDEADPHRVADELADVMLYVCQFAGVAGVDLETAVVTKLNRNYGRSWD